MKSIDSDNPEKAKNLKILGLKRTLYSEYSEKPTRLRRWNGNFVSFQNLYKYSEWNLVSTFYYVDFLSIIMLENWHLSRI